jgi:hypothetical protein
MKTLALRFLFCAFVATALTLSALAQTKPGVIKAVKVQGEVFKLTKDGQSLKLAEGAVLTESDTVTTGKGSSVVLVFMNGSSVKLAGDSKLAIEEFKMDPLEETISVSKLEKEPSVSKTKLNLTYGEMVGEVKHLNQEKGSKFDVETPVGAAGIRGTTFRIIFRPTGDGKAFTFTLSTAEGVVLFTGSTPGASGVDVPNGKEVVVTAQATIDAAGQVKVTSVEVAPVTNISPAAVQVITDTVTNVFTQAQQTVTFTPTEQQAPPPTENPNTNPNKGTEPPPTPPNNPVLTNLEGNGGT